MTSESDIIRNAYEETPYIGEAFAVTHPDNLNRIGTLAGMSPAPTRACRVLDIGCTDGRNLLPMAIAFPQSRFLGLDFSPIEIASAEKLRNLLKVENVEFRCVDVMEFNSSEKFDYIIAQGFYSWVPDGPREKLWDIVSQMLAPQGLFYISYNTLPGWHLKRTSRDLVLFHTRSIENPAQRLAAGRTILDFVVQESPSTPGYKELMTASKHAFHALSPQGAIHDDLGPINNAVYFQDFVADAARNGLAYVGPAVASAEMSLLSPELQSQIMQLSSDRIVRQQYLDFMCGRVFRSSILARTESFSNAQGPKGADALADLYVAGWLTPDQPTVLSVGAPVTFTEQGSKRKFVLQDSRLVNAFREIGAAWPHAVAISRLAIAGDSAATKVLQDTLFNMYEISLVEIHTRPLDEIGNAFGKPRVTAMSRYQAKSGENVVSLRHQVVPANPVLRRFIDLLDGSRDNRELLREFHRIIDQKELVITSTTGTPTHEQIGELFEYLMKTVSDWSLLVA